MIEVEFGKLPVDVLSKIVSYKIGEPEYVKMKNSQALKDLQKKYKTKYTEPRTRKIDKLEVIRSYNVQREEPFKAKHIRHIIQKQRHELPYLLYDHVEDEPNFNANLVLVATAIDETGNVVNMKQNLGGYVEDFNGDNSLEALEEITDELLLEIALYEHFETNSVKIKGIKQLRFLLTIKS